MRFKGKKQLQQALDDFSDMKVIHETVKKVAEKELINAIIGSAKAGVGPGGRKYKPYSKVYAEVVKKAGTTKLWLRGLGKSGRKGGMLDPDNFHIEIQSDGRAFIVWDGDQEYGPVHQEGEGKMPKRKFLHFENNRNFEALMKAYREALDRMTANFNAGRKVG